MRYIITQTQLHSLIYRYLDDMFSKKNFDKELNPHVEDGNTWRINMFDNDGKEKMVYFWFGPGEYDSGDPHNGIGNLHVHPDIVDGLRKTLSIRESKVLDVVADWVSETLDVDIDEISIYPNRKNPANY